MSATLMTALFFTVALLATAIYFLLGSLPLLTLKHDTPMDARFVRAFYNTYCLVTVSTASAAAVSYVFAGWPFLAAGAAAIALMAGILRQKLIPRMDSLRAQIQVDGATAISAFRRIHAVAIFINLTQLALMVWSLIAVSLSLR